MTEELPALEPSSEPLEAPKKRGRPIGAKNKAKAPLERPAPPEKPTPPPVNESSSEEDIAPPKRKRKKKTIIVESSSESEEKIVVVKRKKQQKLSKPTSRPPDPPPERHATLDDMAKALHNAHFQRAIAKQMAYDSYFTRLK